MFPKNQLKTTLLTQSDGRLLMIGVALAFVYAFWLGTKMLYSPEDSQALIGMTATQIIFGRAAGMALGYSMDLKHSTVIPICIVIETILILIFYPLFVFSWRRLLVVKWFKNTFQRIRNSAETNKDIVRKYGIIGLFVFVWLPFWMTGPVVGCVIGFLLNLRVWVIMTTVLAGTVAAIFGWAFFLRNLLDQTATYSHYAAMVLMILLIIIIVAGHILHKTND
jgi:uncharacterized membrane protein